MLAPSDVTSCLLRIASQHADMPDGLEDWLGLRQCVLPFAFATQHLEETQTDLIMKRHFEWALVKVNYRKEAVLSSLGCCLKGEGN